jgi:hypothetical protein
LLGSPTTCASSHNTLTSHFSQLQSTYSISLIQVRKCLPYLW